MRVTENKENYLYEEETNGRWDRRQGTGADCEHNTTVCLHKQVIKEPIVFYTHTQKKNLSTMGSQDQQKL